jgi:hypothetical protein
MREATAQAKRLPPISILILFLGSVATAAVYSLSGSGSQTLTISVCALTLWLLFSTREAQRREAWALKQSLDELRESLRVTHALLEASELQGAEELRSTLLPAAARESLVPASEQVEPRAAPRERERDTIEEETRRVSAVAVV